MIRDWREYRGQINAAVKEIGMANPDLVKAYAAFHHANSASKHLDAKTRELIALGVAIMVNAGATMVYSAHVIDAFHTYSQPNEVTP